MSCLIIGDGPSKYMIDMNKSYNVNCIIGVHIPFHKLTDYVCSLDITSFTTKEKLAVDRNIPLILAINSFSPYSKFNFKPRVFKNNVMRGNSGAFAIEWAIAKGFKEIYTAGIDYHREYISSEALDVINNFIDSCKNIKIYKIDLKSNLRAVIKQIPQ